MVVNFDWWKNLFFLLGMFLLRIFLSLFKMQARTFCFTINNPTHLLDFTREDWKENVRYCVYQKEQGKEGIYMLYYID